MFCYTTMAIETVREPATEETELFLGDDRLFHEINLLRIEGFAFCFDPKAASRRRDKQEFTELIRMAEGQVSRPIVIEPHPTYGIPTVVAYKVFQAALKKLSDEGYEGADRVSFSQRELAKLAGRTSFGGATSHEFLRAMLSLRYTGIWCSFYDKQTQKWRVLNFSLLIDALFSGRRHQINECVITFHPSIVSNFRNRHYICLNYSRLSQLEPIGMALYKHLFFSMSRLYKKLGRPQFSYERDYEAICTTWLGGLKVWGFKSKILQAQLGVHLSGLKRVRLLRSFDVVKKGEGGFKLVVAPGAGFFEDYDRFYGATRQLPFPFKRASEEHTIARPLELLSYFHKRRLGTDEIAEPVFPEKEVAFARSLTEKYPDEVCREIVEYGLERARGQKGYSPQTLPGIGPFINDFFATKAERERATAERAVRVIVERERESLERQKELYDVFVKSEIKRIREQGISSEELEAIEGPLRAAFRQKYPGMQIGLEMYVYLGGNEAIQKRYHIPSFEQWQANRRQPGCGV